MGKQQRLAHVLVVLHRQTDVALDDGNIVAVARQQEQGVDEAVVEQRGKRDNERAGRKGARHREIEIAICDMCVQRGREQNIDQALQMELSRAWGDPADNASDLNQPDTVSHREVTLGESHRTFDSESNHCPHVVPTLYERVE
jgi:hypothetical protein